MARPRLHDDALRTRLLEVTSHLVSTVGTDAVTVRDAARRAGTSSSAVYALFGSRDALVAAVAEEGFRRFAGHLAGVARTDDPGADLYALGLAYRASALADPHFYRAMFDRPLPQAPRPAERETFLVLREAVARVLTARDRHADPDDVAYLLWAQVHGLVTLELAGLLPGPPDEHAARYGRALRAIGAALLG